MEGGEGPLLRLQLLQLQPSLPPEGADAGAVVPDVDRIEALGEGPEVPKPPCDADVADEPQSPSRGPKCNCVDPDVALVLNHGRNVLLLDPLPTRHLLCSPDMLQWPWSGPAGKGVGEEEGDCVVCVVCVVSAVRAVRVVHVVHVVHVAHVAHVVHVARVARVA